MKNLEEELDSFKTAIKLLSESVEDLGAGVVRMNDELGQVIDNQVEIATSTAAIANAVHERLCLLEKAEDLVSANKVEDLPTDLN